ncbi:recombinase family protein [Nocardia sp. NPDC049526]|uniref:recombinase family protein n=1 Tax=Nocardia sp. NPDC049526 TaxID=3364316 RepID=UPI0037A1EE59
MLRRACFDGGDVGESDPARRTGIDLIVLEQGIDTTTPAGQFVFHVIAAMDEMTADLISEGTLEGLESARVPES